MRPLLTRLAVLGAAALALPAFAAGDDGPIKLSPQQIGDIFCIARIGNDMAPVEAMLTASLKKAIATADRLNDKWSAKNPGEKPPLGDGLPWQSAPDYAPVCKADHVVLQASGAEVSINYGFPDQPVADFVDIVRLKLVADPIMDDKIWRIDDIALANGDTMRSEMIDAFTP